MKKQESCPSLVGLPRHVNNFAILQAFSMELPTIYLACKHRFYKWPREKCFVSFNRQWKSTNVIKENQDC